MLSKNEINALHFCKVFLFHIRGEKMLGFDAINGTLSQKGLSLYQLIHPEDLFILSTLHNDSRCLPEFGTV